jgi:hypothetical protein
LHDKLINPKTAETPMDQTSELTVKFSCPPEMERVLPRPIPAIRGLPDWFKALPHHCFSSVSNKELMTVKKCPPFIDAMTFGFLMPLVADLKVENGEFTWVSEIPVTGYLRNLTRSPIDYHDSVQVKGTPYFDDDRFIIKFNNFWTIGLPPGYSLFVTHPVNRADLPFTTLTGLVDSDLYVDSLVHFPARWNDPTFSGVLSKGTPVAQCIAIKRETWVEQFGVLSEQAAQRLLATAGAIAEETGIYRREFRAPKR